MNFFKMKLLVLLVAIIIVSFSLGDSTTSGLGGMFGKEQRFHGGGGKVIEDTEKRSININSPESTTQMVRQSFHKRAGTSREDDDVKLQHIDGRA